MILRRDRWTRTFWENPFDEWDRSIRSKRTECKVDPTIPDFEHGDNSWLRLCTDFSKPKSMYSTCLSAIISKALLLPPRKSIHIKISQFWYFTTQITLYWLTDFEVIFLALSLGGKFSGTPENDNQNHVMIH